MRELYDRLGVSVLDVPTGLETDQRVGWIVQRVAETDLVLAG
ncbi:MAG TPA: hypothetical protein VJT72_09165 [Pseudonocardiaceae bacterium]|nr:hypothetical protein [Pseudonocardiaceae bacterium]